MKSFRQFIVEDQVVIPSGTPGNRIVDFKRFVLQYKKKTGKNISQKEFDKWVKTQGKENQSKWTNLINKRKEAASERLANQQGRNDAIKDMGPSSFDSEDPTDPWNEPKKKKKIKLDDTTKGGEVHKTKRPSITSRWKKRPFGKVTGLDPQTGTAKYVPPKDVPKSELKGPNIKGEIVNRRRAKRAQSNAPSYADVKAKIDAKEPVRRLKQPRVTKQNFWNNFPSKNPSSYKPFGDKPVKPDFGTSTVPTNKPPIKLTKPSDIKVPKSFSDFSKKLKDLRSTISKPPSKPPVVNQAEVSKDAADFTAETNRKRIKKIHKVSVAGPTTSPTGSSYTPKTPPKIEPVIRGSSGPKFDSAYDKRAPDSSNPLKKKTKTFKDMAKDSREALTKTKTKQPKTLVSKLKTVTRRNLTKFLRGTKTWGTGKSSTTKLPFTQNRKGPQGSSTYIPNPGQKVGGGKKIKTSSGNWDGKVYGALAGYSGYQQEREQGSSQKRSVASGITQGAGTAIGTQVVANTARWALKNAPVHPWIKSGIILGGSLWASGESQRRSKKLFDYVAGPNQATKNKTANKNKTNNKAIPLLPGNKKKKKQLPNTFLSFSGSK